MDIAALPASGSGSNTGAASATASVAASLQRVASQSSLVQATAPHHYHYIQYPAHYLQQQHNQPSIGLASAAALSPQQCQCPCSCGRASGTQQQQQQQNASMAVAVLVHQQTSTPAQQTGLKTQSAQSLLNHSYQALPNEEREQRERHNLPFDTSASSARCDCDLECSCAANSVSLTQQHKRSLLADAMLGADEITVSESDNNSTMIKKKKPRSNAADQLPSKTQPTDSCNDIYHDTELEVAATATASGSGGAGGAKAQGLDDNRPPLPPRPPPRPRSTVNGSIGECTLDYAKNLSRHPREEVNVS